MVKENPHINKQKYVFLPYNKQYPSMFLKEKNKIEKSLGKNIKIEHVGSTSIPGLGGKGIIDIAIKTPRNKINQFIDKLKRLGYESNLEHQRTDKSIFLQKKIKHKRKERRIHIHLTLNNKFWNSFIVFRDYIRNHDKERNEYAKIKKEAVKYAKGHSQKYREYKKKFLENLIKKALKTKY
ncbi:GrpB family protein [Candidatus Pacearchaeota archaeon]|nr:GrpB family protein [Candidatus Pacearchaeota archaeon]